MLKFLGKILPRRLHSGSEKFPDPLHVFQSLISDIVNLDLGPGDKAFFRCKCSGCKGWAEVRPWYGLLLVTISFPFKESPDKILNEKELTLSKQWGVHSFKKGKQASFVVGTSDIDTISPFLDKVFRILYDCPQDYRLFGKLVLGFWNSH